jgi:glycosyltransferase involved in cell wall biosynthesis
MLMSTNFERGQRVLMVAPQPFYEDRGTPIAIRHVLDALSASGHPVDLLTFAGGRDVAIPGLRIFRIGTLFGFKHIPIGFSLRKLALDIVLVFALLRMLRKANYACIHAVEEAVFPALVLGRWFRIPVIYDMQSCLPDQLRDHVLFGRSLMQRVLRRFEKWALRSCAVVVGSAGLEPYVKRVEPDIFVREWNFPGQINHVTPKQALEQREGLDIPAEAPVVLYSGNFARYQGVEWLVEAIPQVVAAVPDAIFVLVGAEPGSMSSEMRKAVEAVPTGALKIVRRQPRDELPYFIALADILVSPRAGGDNLPLKIFDYIAAGKPIVATDYPIHRTVLSEDRSVLVAPNPPAIAEGVIRLLQDRKLAHRLGAAAQSHSNAYYGLAAFQALVEDIYRHAGVESPLAAARK